MIIIWRGWGFLVLPIMFACALVAEMMGNALTGTGLASNWAHALGYVIATAVGSAGIWIIAKLIVGNKPPRRLVDQATGQEVVIRADAGSLFFIPTRFWAFIVLGLGLLLALSQATGYDLSTKTAADPAPATQKL